MWIFAVTIMLGKEFCGLYKIWCGKFFKFWTCHLIIEFNVFWLLCCFCSSLAWHCEFTCFLCYQKSLKRKAMWRLAIHWLQGAVTNFSFAVHLLLAYIASHFHASYIFLYKSIKIPKACNCHFLTICNCIDQTFLINWLHLNKNLTLSCLTFWEESRK